MVRLLGTVVDRTTRSRSGGAVNVRRAQVNVDLLDQFGVDLLVGVGGQVVAVTGEQKLTPGT